MNIAYLSLGSNLGHRENYLERAREFLKIKVGIIKNNSSVYETEPWSDTSIKTQNAIIKKQTTNYKLQTTNYYLNQVVCMETELSPQELLEQISVIEQGLGRERGEVRWLPRTIDIDILFYNDILLNEPNLTIPHPLLQERKFVLIPLAEIAPQLMHPLLKKSVLVLLKECNDNSRVMKYEV